MAPGTSAYQFPMRSPDGSKLWEPHRATPNDPQRGPTLGVVTMNQDQYATAHGILCKSFSVESKALWAITRNDYDPRWYEMEMRFRAAVYTLIRCRDHA